MNIIFRLTVALCCFAPFGAEAQIVSRPAPSIVSALLATATKIQNSPGLLSMVMCSNTNSSTEFVQVFDAATPGAVTVGTTAPKLSIPFSPNNAGGFVLSGGGLNFLAGIQVAATTTQTGNTAPGTGLDCSFGVDQPYH